MTAEQIAALEQTPGLKVVAEDKRAIMVVDKDGKVFRLNRNGQLSEVRRRRRV